MHNERKSDSNDGRRDDKKDPKRDRDRETVRKERTINQI